MVGVRNLFSLGQYGPKRCQDKNIYVYWGRERSVWTGRLVVPFLATAGCMKSRQATKPRIASDVTSLVCDCV